LASFRDIYFKFDTNCPHLDNKIWTGPAYIVYISQLIYSRLPTFYNPTVFWVMLLSQEFWDCVRNGFLYYVLRWPCVLSSDVLNHWISLIWLLLVHVFVYIGLSSLSSVSFVLWLLEHFQQCGSLVSHIITFILSSRDNVYTNDSALINYWKLLQNLITRIMILYFNAILHTEIWSKTVFLLRRN
jgi:hypothetical protein